MVALARQTAHCFTFVDPEVAEVELPPVRNTYAGTFILHSVRGAKKVHHLSRTDHAEIHITRGPHFGSPKASLALQALHQCFSEHVPLSLRPEVVWYWVVNEVATHVKLNPGEYAKLFHGDPLNKRKITVRDDSLVYDSPSNNWGHSIRHFRRPIEQFMGSQLLNLFVPSFSTSTDESEVALLLTFMDAASPYYEYEEESWCGIPKIRLEGTASDWILLQKSIGNLALIFPLLKDYFSDLAKVTFQIMKSVSSRHFDQSFWRSIYKYESMSGGDEVSGWINAFFAHCLVGDKLELKQNFDWQSEYGRVETFPAHLSQIPFIWKCRGDEIPMAFICGIFGTEYRRPYLTPRLGFGVLEAPGQY